MLKQKVQYKKEQYFVTNLKNETISMRPIFNGIQFMMKNLKILPGKEGENDHILWLSSSLSQSQKSIQYVREKVSEKDPFFG